jgi:hypothetical protein
MRLLLALVFLGLALAVSGQSPTVPSSAVVAASASVAPSASGTGTGTYPQPPAPVGLDNFCKNHIINICPGWTDPTGVVFGAYKLYVTDPTGLTQEFDLAEESTRITSLTAATAYTVKVQGQDGNGVWSLNSTDVIMTTNVTDPKNDPTRDIQAFTCVKGTNAKNNRVSATCSWTAAQDAVRQINYKVHCVSTLREPTLVRRRVYGATAAAATNAFFAINRDTASCTFKARFYYERRPTTRHSFTLSF